MGSTMSESIDLMSGTTVAGLPLLISATSATVRLDRNQHMKKAAKLHTIASAASKEQDQFKGKIGPEFSAVKPKAGAASSAPYSA